MSTEPIFTTAERKAVEDLARRRGFSELREYVRTLIKVDATEHNEVVPLVEDIDDDDEHIRASIQQGYREVLHGEVLTEDEFWKATAEDE